MRHLLVLLDNILVLVNKTYKKIFDNNPVNLVITGLLLLSSLIYLKESSWCNYYHPSPIDKEWSVLYNIFTLTIYILFCEALALTNSKILRLITSVLVGWFLADLITCLLPHQEYDIITRTTIDKLIIVGTVIIAILNYEGTSTLYKILNKWHKI